MVIISIWKKQSIKKKIIIAFSGIYLFMNLLLLSLNQVLSDDFFIANNFNNMDKHVLQSIEDLNSMDVNEYDLEKLADELQQDTGSDVNIINNDLSFDRLPKGVEDQLVYVTTSYRYLFDQALETGDAVNAVIGDGQYINRKILYIKVLPSDDIVVIIKSLGLIMEAQEVFIKFLALTGAFVYFVSIVLVYIFADRFTRPIKMVEKIAYQISLLDFGNRLDESRQDEIGSLNRHVNSMASKLSTTIHDLNNTNERLTRELNKERNMEAMREQFVSDVSHELKNPISMIIGYAEGLKRGFAKTEEDKAFYNKVILEEGERMNELVEELLDLSSYKSGSITLDREMIDLGDLISKSMDKYKLIQEERNIKVSVKIDDDISINADSVRMGQVINNLLDNAFKYTNNGGKIRVVLNNHEEKSLTISNTGKLIAQKEYEKIWNSFYQVDTDNKGSGIGLAIVKSILELHGFRIEGFTHGGMNNFRICF